MLVTQTYFLYVYRSEYVALMYHINKCNFHLSLYFTLMPNKVRYAHLVMYHYKNTIFLYQRKKLMV